MSIGRSQFPWIRVACIAASAMFALLAFVTTFYSAPKQEVMLQQALVPFVCIVFRLTLRAFSRKQDLQLEPQPDQKRMQLQLSSQVAYQVLCIDGTVNGRFLSCLLAGS